MVRLSTLSAWVALAAVCVGAVSGQQQRDFDYSQANCTEVLGELSFSPEDHTATEADGYNYFFPLSADFINLVPFTAEVGTTATTIQITLADNSGANPNFTTPSGPVAGRFALYTQTVAGASGDGTGVGEVNPQFELLMQTEQIMLDSPVAGIYNATLINPDGTFGTFTPVVGVTYFLAEWFSASVLQDYDSTNGDAFTSNVQFDPTGYPASVMANLTGYGGYNSATGGNYESPIALSQCVGPLVSPPGNPGTVVGDPQFNGLRGQSYQVHGIDGAHYNLITSDSTQVNARFVYLQSGVCPPLPSASNCWSHPGSYLGAVGVMELVNGVAQKLAVEAGPARRGFTNVTFNGELLTVGSTVTVGTLSVQFVDSYHLTVDTAEFSISFDNSDRFINQQISSRVPLSQLSSHGLLGQTHHMRRYNSAVKYIEGSVDDYSVSENSLWGVDFPFNQFQTSK